MPITKPVITYSGDVQLFNSLQPGLLQALPQETVEWKRSYGRPPRAVTLSAVFEPLKESPGLKPFTRLSECQVLHIYFLECSDVETYKGSVKDGIQAWFNQLRKVEFQDWLVVLVETTESRKASSKLLPRTTVLDRIKSDFGGKTAERCLSVLDPCRGQDGSGPARSCESWQTFLFRLRQALMAAFSRALSKFEEIVRTQRERRNDAEWNFCDYFLLQEEMAFVFETLELYDEALVQYDELDALFTQFVLNTAVGDAPKWLTVFQNSPNNWSGVCLNSECEFNAKLRRRIEDRSMSVIDFRNYLFSRQCSLLLISFKPPEVARRCLSYVQNCTHEINLLKVEAVEGAIPCWILLTCLQVLSACQIYGASSGAQQAMEHFALLWNVAKDKLHELGQRCGLVPGAVVGSQELHCIATISSGIVDCDHPIGNVDVVPTSSRPTPVEKLKEALSSPAAFTKHYLELSELAMGTFKHCGRLRSARLIGRDLSRFYIQLGQPNKSVSFLVDLLRGYHEENWIRLKADTHMELARVYQQLGDQERFTEAAAHIAAYPVVDLEIRKDFFDRMLRWRTAEQKTKSIAGSEMIHLESVDIDYDPNLEAAGLGPGRVLCDSTVRARLRVVSRWPVAVDCRQVSVSLKCLRINPEIKSGAKKTSTTADPPVPLAVDEVKKPFVPTAVLMKEQQNLKQDGGLSSVALVCQNTHHILGRKVSSGLPLMDLSAVKEDYTHALHSSDVHLEPGANDLVLEMRADTEGQFALNQFVVSVGALELIEPVSCFAGHLPALTVVRVTPTVTVNKCRDDLLAGMEQDVQLVLRTGSTCFDQETKLKLSTSWGLGVRIKDGSKAAAPQEGFQRELELRLKPMTTFDTATFDLSILADMTNFPKDATTMSHKLVLQCPWLTKSPPMIDLPLHISAPLTAQFKLHTANTRKFINVHVQGLTPNTRSFHLQQPVVQLSENTFKHRLLSQLELVSLNQGSGSLMKISQEQSANFLWELRGIPTAEEDLPVIKAEFQVQFRPAASDSEWRKFVHHFDIVDYSTLFTVRSRVDPVKGNDFLRAGSLCHMTLTVNAVRAPADGVSATALMYEVLADQALWAVCGRTAGVFSMDGSSKHTVTLDVMPLVCGFLPLPAVRLSRYIPADQKVKDTGNRNRPDLGMTSPTLPRLEPFSPGQVYNWSKAQQVHVLAAPSNTSTGGNGISLETSLP